MLYIKGLTMEVQARRSVPWTQTEAKRILGEISNVPEERSKAGRFKFRVIGLEVELKSTEQRIKSYNQSEEQVRLESLQDLLNTAATLCGIRDIYTDAYMGRAYKILNNTTKEFTTSKSDELNKDILKEFANEAMRAVQSGDYQQLPSLFHKTMEYVNRLVEYNEGTVKALEEARKNGKVLAAKIAKALKGEKVSGIEDEAKKISSEIIYNAKALNDPEKFAIDFRTMTGLQETLKLISRIVEEIEATKSYEGPKSELKAMMDSIVNVLNEVARTGEAPKSRSPMVSSGTPTATSTAAAQNTNQKWINDISEYINLPDHEFARKACLSLIAKDKDIGDALSDGRLSAAQTEVLYKEISKAWAKYARASDAFSSDAKSFIPDDESIDKMSVREIALLNAKAYVTARDGKNALNNKSDDELLERNRELYDLYMEAIKKRKKGGLAPPPLPEEIMGA